MRAASGLRRPLPSRPLRLAAALGRDDGVVVVAFGAARRARCARGRGGARRGGAVKAWRPQLKSGEAPWQRRASSSGGAAPRTGVTGGGRRRSPHLWRAGRLGQLRRRRRPDSERLSSGKGAARRPSRDGRGVPGARRLSMMLRSVGGPSSSRFRPSNSRERGVLGFGREGPPSLRPPAAAATAQRKREPQTMALRSHEGRCPACYSFGRLRVSAGPPKYE